MLTVAVSVSRDGVERYSMDTETNIVGGEFHLLQWSRRGMYRTRAWDLIRAAIDSSLKLFILTCFLPFSFQQLEDLLLVALGLLWIWMAI